MRRFGAGRLFPAGGVLTAAAVALAAACGSPAPSQPLAKASGFCAELRHREAAFAARCRGGSEADWFAYYDSSPSCAALDQLVAKGTVRYHEELASACIDAHPEDADCFYDPSLCSHQVLEGLRPTGAPCASTFECPANSACLDPSNSHNACEIQTCVTFPSKAGDDCRDSRLCLDPNLLSCVNGVCVANGDVGASCGGVTLPGCRRGLYCELATMTCTARTASGPCTSDLGCLQTHFCSAGTCAPRLPIGAPCADAPTGCAAFAACGASQGVCVPAGHEGQPCAFPFTCASGICRTDAVGQNACLSRKPLGAVCATGDECVSGGCLQAVCTACPP